MELFKYENRFDQESWAWLNDKKGEPFSPIDDARFEKMFKLDEQFKHMNVLKSTYNSRGHVSTFDTSNALSVIWTGLVSLIKLLLNHGFSHVLPRNFQNDRLEVEVRICSQSSGECYYISNMLLLCCYVSNCTIS